MTVQEIALDHSIGFIMGITHRKLALVLQNRLKNFDITPEQWSVLYLISRVDGLIQKEIAQRSGKDKPTTTRILDHLETKGLIYKKTGSEDRRSFVVHITDKGRSLIQETEPIERQLVNDIKECMSEEEYEILMKLILRILSYANNELAYKDQERDGQ